MGNLQATTHASQLQGELLLKREGSHTGDHGEHGLKRFPVLLVSIIARA